MSGAGSVTAFGGYAASGEAKTALNDAVKGHRNAGHDVGFIMMDLASRKGVAYNCDALCYGASSIKAPCIASVAYEYPDVTTRFAYDITETLFYSWDKGERVGKWCERPNVSTIHMTLGRKYRTRSKGAWNGNPLFHTATLDLITHRAVHGRKAAQSKSDKGRPDIPPQRMARPQQGAQAAYEREDELAHADAVGVCYGAQAAHEEQARTLERVPQHKGHYIVDLAIVLDKERREHVERKGHDALCQRLGNAGGDELKHAGHLQAHHSARALSCALRIASAILPGVQQVPISYTRA